MTITQATSTLRSKGISLRFRNGEFRVNFTRGQEATAYYTDDLEDAYNTAHAMLAGRESKESQ